MEDIQLSGVFVLSFAHACVNLRVLVGEEAEELAATKPDAWLPAPKFGAIFEAIGKRFRHFEPVKERVGMEMMRLWYEHGPGRSVVERGVDFLRFQAGSQGYHSVVRGPADQIGAFTLEDLDEKQRTARMRSTTPFDRTMERGILIGGMKLAGDLDFVEVENAGDPSVFQIRFA